MKRVMAVHNTFSLNWICNRRGATCAYQTSGRKIWMKSVKCMLYFNANSWKTLWERQQHCFLVELKWNGAKSLTFRSGFAISGRILQNGLITSRNFTATNNNLLGTPHTQHFLKKPQKIRSNPTKTEVSGPKTRNTHCPSWWERIFSSDRLTNGSAPRGRPLPNEHCAPNDTETLRYFRIWPAHGLHVAPNAGHVTDDVGALLGYVNAGRVAVAGSLDTIRIGSCVLLVANH